MPYGGGSQPWNQPWSSDVDDVRFVVSNLRSDHEQLEERVDQLEREQREQAEEAGRLDSSLDELQSHLDDHEVATHQDRVRLDRLVRRLDVLEHHLRAASSAEPATLDDATPETDALVAAVHDGHAAETRLLEPGRRNALEGLVSDYEQLLHDHDQCFTAAMEHTKYFAEEASEQATSDSLGSAFATIHQRISELEQKIAAKHDAYNDARRTLTTEDAAQRDARPVIVAGERAGRELRRLLRERLQAAVADHALLPAWFTSALGYAPPSNPDTWLTTATEVVTYRVLYDARDPVSALGPLPQADQPARLRYHQRIMTALKRFA